MREAYHEQLDRIVADLEAIAFAAANAVVGATDALFGADRLVAERVISQDAWIDNARTRVEDDAFILLSLQQPVAGDLRTLVAALRIVTELERIGDLAAHVAKIARMRVPDLAVPADLGPLIAQMAEVAQRMTGQLPRIIADRDIDAAADLARTDDEVDQLRRASMVALLSQDWSGGVEAAVDVALLGRYYERIADHAVSIANRIVYVATGRPLAHL